METNQNSTETLSQHACMACKRHKRRCDKDIPKCGLCQRTGRACEYVNTPDGPPTVAEFNAIRAKLNELEDRLAAAPPTAPFPSSSSAGAVHLTSHDALLPARRTASPTQSTNHVEDRDEFPAALFLDFDYFIAAGLQVPPPRVTIPMVCSSCQEEY